MIEGNEADVAEGSEKNELYIQNGQMTEFTAEYQTGRLFLMEAAIRTTPKLFVVSPPSQPAQSRALDGLTRLPSCSTVDDGRLSAQA
jgi:hypothetical protein